MSENKNASHINVTIDTDEAIEGIQRLEEQLIGISETIDDLNSIGIDIQLNIKIDGEKLANELLKYE